VLVAEAFDDDAGTEPATSPRSVDNPPGVYATLPPDTTNVPWSNR
jgi:hypothetical protein